MSDTPQIDGLQLNQDLTFQRHEWRVQRIGWAAMALAMIAAVTGLMGGGPLSTAARASPDRRVQIEYERFLRYRDPSVLHVYLQPEAVADEEVRLSLNRAYLQGVEFTRIIPEPHEERIGSEEHTFVFRADELRTSAWVAIHFEADVFGALEGELKVGDGEGVRFRQYIYP
jgi:hypothetical protein